VASGTAIRTSGPRWKFRTTFTARTGNAGSVVVVAALPVALDGRQERRLEMCDRARRGLAVHELGLASGAERAEAPVGTLQADGDDASVLVAMLDRRILGHVDGPH